MIIDGKSIAAKRLADLKNRISELGVSLKLGVVVVGDNEASEMYVKMKRKRAEEVGIESDIVKLPQSVSKLELVKKIRDLNEDRSVTGILIQLPLPKEVDTQDVLQSIDPAKDVDGLTDNSHFLPATVKAVLIAIQEGLDGQKLSQKTVTVIGQGRLVGKPLSEELVRLGATVNCCDEFTDKNEVKELARRADILVTATGVAGLVTTDLVKPGTIVIDCGAPLPEVDLGVAEIAGAITPVPGGIGPLTVVSLLENIVQAYERRENLSNFKKNND
jgi:methylenetetrahydrofolate dehydrogenase (NADP+)/methenyltetrahydrofolate cyclohydrolase